MAKDDFEKIFNNKERIMVVMAHPDDAEILAGGTIIRLISAGKIVRVVKVTSGDKGSRQNQIDGKTLARLRQTEDKAAMKVLGVTDDNNIYLNLEDGTVENDLDTISAIAHQIRLFKPDLIITHNPENLTVKMPDGSFRINHRDHRNSGKSTVDAAYPYSRDLLFFPEHFQNPAASPHSVSELLLANYYCHHDTISIDVGDCLETKQKALFCHASQYTPEKARQEIVDFTDHSNGTSFEKFRYLKIS